MSVLAEQTLVLNKAWTAIATTSVRNALVLAYRDVARIICPETYETHDFRSWAEVRAAEGEPAVATPAFRIRVPEIVVLARYSGFPRRAPAFSRRNIYRRDGYTCQYCGAKPGSELLSIDHVVPRSRGGKSTWENCVLACLACNKRKANRSLAHSGLDLRRRPIQPKWGGNLGVPVGRRPASWERFVSDRYWNVELES